MEEKVEKEKIEEIKIEKRTLEQLLKDLRESKKWTYIHLIEELHKLGITVDDKKIKKWEIGLEYPDLDMIYKLSEIYSVPSESFIMAKNNSLKTGMAAVHTMLIKWICYFTGVSLKIAYVLVYIIFIATFIGAFLFFINNAQYYLEVRKMMNG